MTLQFWQGWPRSNRIFFLVFLSVFVATLIYMWVAYFVEPAPAIELRTFSEPEIGEITVDQFQKGPFTFTVKGNNYVILQRQLGSMLTTSNAVAYVYLVVLVVFVIGMLAVISTLSKFYYVVGMGLFFLFVTSMKTEVLGVFGLYSMSFAIVVFAMYGFTSFWFFYFATAASFTFRIAAFTAVTFLLWMVINFMSETERPFLHLATYGVEAGLIACALFIVTVAHEIVAAFVFAVSQNPRTRKSLNHFLIITVIYLINLALAYAVRYGYIKWHIVTVDLFLLLTISAILGIWGIRQRQKTYEGIIDADPYAVFAFLLTGAVAFTAIAMFMLSANDTALSSILDIIIFTHIGFGLIFLTYVFSNFAGMLAQNYRVYKVLYTPNNMPFFTFRFAGLIATIAFAIYNTWQIPVNNAKSGYFNALGDLYIKMENKPIAKAYFDESRSKGYRGHHANYALANLEGSLFNARDENLFYIAACGPRPTEMSFLNLAQTYQSSDDNLQAIVTLREGITRLKKRDALENTLGLLYAKTGMPDSAMKYLSQAKGSSANILGLAAIRKVMTNDTTQELSHGPVMTVNRLALLNSLSKKTGAPYELPKDTVLTLADAAAISNYLINSRDNEDTAFVRRAMLLARKPSNDGFKEAILFASALSLYNSGETKEAFTTLEEVTVTSQHQGKYNNILAMWALENDEPGRAAGYADYAVSQGYAPAKLTHAVVTTESGNLKDASVEWDSLRTRGDSITIRLANQLYRSLSQPITTLHDNELYSYARYRMSAVDSNLLLSLIGQMQDDNLKARTLLDQAQKLYTVDKPSATIRSLQRIVGLELTDASIGTQMQVLELLARVQSGSKKDVLNALKQNPVDLKGKNKKYRVYFDALEAEARGDSAKANVYYEWLANANPYFEDGVIAAAKYFSNKAGESYNLLAEAMLYHPSSTRIRKAYALESARVGFEDYARNSLAVLQSKINAKDYAELSRQVELLLAGSRE
jgi:hypothetical protein